MNIIIQNYTVQAVPNFCARKIIISKEQIIALRNQGKKETEIPKILGISVATYYEKLKQLGLSTAISGYRKKLADIPKDEFEKMLKEKAPIDTICKKFNLTTNAYYNYINNYGLRSYIVGANRKAVTKEELQEFVKQKLSVNEICEHLGIGKDAYYELLQKFNIITEYKNKKLNIDNITKDQLISLIESNKTYPEICKELGISQSTLQKLVLDYKIETKILQTKKNVSGITKEQLQKLIDSGKSNAEICKELSIPIRTYTFLTNHFGIITNLRQAKINVSNITKEELQTLVNAGFSREEICSILNLSGEGMFYKLLKRLNIQYNYKHHIGEIIIPKDDLQRVVNEWESHQDIQEKLNISNTSFYEKSKIAKVKTVMSNSIEKIKSLNIKEIQNKLDNGATPKEICDMFDITLSMYHSLIRQYGLISKAKRKFLNVKSITKEHLEELINANKMTKEICQELDISVNTYMRLLKKFRIERN